MITCSLLWYITDWLLVEQDFLKGTSFLIAKHCAETYSRRQFNVGFSKQRVVDGQINCNKENDSAYMCACARAHTKCATHWSLKTNILGRACLEAEISSDLNLGGWRSFSANWLDGNQKVN